MLLASCAMPEDPEQALSVASEIYSALSSRKIVHVDMDAFYASVE